MKKTEIKPPETTKWIMSRSDLPTRRGNAQFQINKADGEREIITVSNRKWQVLQALMGSPIYCASPVRLSDIVLLLRTENGINIETEFYRETDGDERARFGVYILIDRVRYGAVNSIRDTGKTLVIYALYDFDRSGQDAACSLHEKVERFGMEFDVPVQFQQLGLSFDQVEDLNLPTRPAKRNSVADRRWPYDFAAELDAIPPDTIRDMVRDAIEYHLPRYELNHLKRVEKAERETLLQFIGEAC